MVSLDVDLLFTNVPLEETIKICIDELFKSDMTVSGLNKKEMFELLSLTLKESIILFDNKYYSQIDGVAMGSPLGPTLANIFLCYHESNWFKDCPKNFKPIFYKRYVDDIFVLFNNCLNHNEITIHQRNLQVLMTEIYKIINHTAPPIMSSLFEIFK